MESRRLDRYCKLTPIANLDVQPLALSGCAVPLRIPLEAHLSWHDSNTKRMYIMQLEAQHHAWSSSDPNLS